MTKTGGNMRNVLFSDREDEVIRAMVDRGATLHDLMAVLQRPRQSLECHMRRMGLSAKRVVREVDEEAFKKFMKGR